MKLRHFLDLPFLPDYSNHNMEESHSVLKFSIKGGDVKSTIKRSFQNLDSEYLEFTEDVHFCWFAAITRLLSFKISKIFVISQHKVRYFHSFLHLDFKRSCLISIRNCVDTYYSRFSTKLSIISILKKENLNFGCPTSF